jgi:hypothetical protein
MHKNQYPKWDHDLSKPTEENLCCLYTFYNLFSTTRESKPYEK